MSREEQKVVFLRGRKVILRPLSKSTDLERCVRWVNDPGTNQYLLVYLPISSVEEEEWFNNLHKDKHNIVLMIETLQGVPIGTIGLHQINWKDRTAVTGTLIGEERYRNKGYGTDAKMTLLAYAFQTLNLRKVCSSVSAFNERSLRYSLRCGYAIEGRRRKHFFRNGRYWDEILLAVFREKWLPLWEHYRRTGKVR